MTEKHAFSMRTFAANVRRCIDRQKLTITLAKIAEGLGVPLWVLMRPDPQSGCEKLKGKSSSIATAFESAVETLLAASEWSKQDLADAIGMDRSSLSKTIRGVHSPTLMVVEKIAAALEVSPAELLR